MTKSLLEEVNENAKFLALCPICAFTPGLSDNNRNQMGPGSNGFHKRGRWKGYPRSSMPVCRFCRGARVLYLNRVCDCGMPAILHDTKRHLWFCGAEDCARSIIWRLERLAVVGHSNVSSATGADQQNWSGL